LPDHANRGFQAFHEGIFCLRGYPETKLGAKANLLDS
jgi:hypothetical protein